MGSSLRQLLGSAGLIAAAVSAAPLAAEGRTGLQFIGIEDFSRFRTDRDRDGAIVLASPEMLTRIEWDELIVSWNVELPPGADLVVEARPVLPESASHFYGLGVWAPGADARRRHSVTNQHDLLAEVQTDVLVLRRRARGVQLRLTLHGLEPRAAARLKFVGLSLRDSTAPALKPGSDGVLRARSLEVPQRSQMHYPGGAGWCSPTSLSMVLAFWSRELRRGDLDVPVPTVAAHVDDPNWPGTGNWPFNTAYAGAFPGLRAYVTRLAHVAELEQWIGAGVPVVVSVEYATLQGRPGRNDGHLIVCTGFDASGDVIVNDPGTSEHIRRTFPRAQFAAAWAYSRNTVYLVYPEGTRTPQDPGGHWFPR